MRILNKKGFTLIELLITLLITGIISTAIYDLYLNYYRSSVIQDQLTQLQQNSRGAISDIERELRMAGYGINSDAGQANFVTAAPYEVAFNADIDSSANLLAINPGAGPNQVPANPGAGISAYIPSVDYSTGGTGAETVRWTIDSNDDGIIDNSDRMVTIDADSTTNQGVYRLYRQAFGFNGTDNEIGLTGGGGGIPVMAEGIRGPDPYPDGSRPGPLFQYWIKEDKNDDGVIDSNDNEMDVNGNNIVDEYLWGDDGSNGGTPNNGILEQGEITALLTGNGGGPKPLYMSNAPITNSNGDTRATVVPTTLANELGNISRVVITITAESLKEDENYKSSSHGASYKYHESKVTSTVAPRNPVVSVSVSPIILLSASPVELFCPFPNASLITATVIDDQGNPIPGVLISFSAAGGSFSNSSSVTTASGTTDSNGQTSVSLFNITGLGGSASVMGTGTINGKNYSGLATVYFKSGAANVITVVSNPDAIPADGVRKSIITAQVLDQCGLPVADNTAINFSITTSPSGIGGSISPAATITSQGNASTILTAGISSGTASITATEPVTGTNGFVNVPFTTCILTLVPDYNTIMGDGVSSTNITATLLDLSNNPVNGIQVDFVTTEGTLSPLTGTTDSNGQAVVSLTSSPYPHTADITGSVPASAIQCANSIGLTRVYFTGCNITVQASPVSVPLGGTTTVTSTFIDPTNGSPISTPVTLTLDNNLLGTLSPLSGNTDINGQFISTFTANNTTPGTVRIKAVGDCGEGILDLPIKSCNIVVSANPSWILPDGISTSGITATVTDSITNNPMANESVTFSLTLNPNGIGGSLSPLTANTDPNGVVTTTLTSGTSPGIAQIDAAASCGTGSVNVDFNGWSIALSANPTDISNGGGASGQSLLTANIYENGVLTQPPVGSDVIFTFVTPDLGAIINPGIAAPSGGIAQSTLISSAGTGTLTVKAEIMINSITIYDTVDITITSSGGLLSYVSASAGTCGGGNEKVGFVVQNDHSDYVNIQSMTISWDNSGAYLDKIKSEGNPPSANQDPCKGGQDVWKHDGCGGGGSRVPSGTTVSTASCPQNNPTSVKINQGAQYIFNELKFKDGPGGGANNIDMSGVQFTITFHYTIGTDTTVYTSTINFTTPT